MSSLFAASDGSGLLIGAILLGWGFIKMCQAFGKVDKSGQIKKAARDGLIKAIFKLRK